MSHRDGRCHPPNLFVTLVPPEYDVSRSPKMSSRSIPPCDHELRPGTAVCLRCQHAERAARRARQRQIMARGTAVAMVLGVIAAIGMAGASVIRNRAWTEGTETLVRSAEPQADSATDATVSPTTDPTPTVEVPQRTAGSAAAPAAMAVSRP